MISTTNSYDKLRLKEISLRYNPGNMIADMIAPTVMVQKQSGKILSYGTDHLRIVNTIKAEGAKGVIMENTFSVADHYFIEPHQVGEYISEEMLNNAELPLNPQADTVMNLIDTIKLGKEYALAQVLTNATATNLSQNTTLSGTSQWSDYNNSDPFSNITTAISTIRDGSFGKEANTIIMGWAVMQKIVYHPDIVAMFPGAGAITKDMLKNAIGSIFGIQNVLIGSAVYNTAVKGSTAVKGDVWGKHVIVAYIEPRPTLMSRSLAFTYAQKNNRDVNVRALNSDTELLQRKAMYCEVTESYDQVLVDEKCAYLVKNAVA